jgi:hypothetical protein
MLVDDKNTTRAVLGLSDQSGEPLLALHHANGKNAIIMSIVPRAEAVGGGEPYVYLIGPDGTHRSRLQTFGAGVSTQRYGGLAVMNKQGEEAVELFGGGLLPMRGPGLQVYGPSRDKAKRWLRSGTVFIGLTNDDEPHLLRDMKKRGNSDRLPLSAPVPIAATCASPRRLAVCSSPLQS